MPNLSISSLICVRARQNQKDITLNNTETLGLFPVCRGFAIAYRRQKSLVFLLELASRQTPAPTAEHRCD